ncbi:hypothetical protein RRG08_052504 [Elysia crispata]|uniref:Uncharacterized protein n=1 Tax=Elysia crispata TaxID=231223 RepID=A0AAE0XNS2_9GAST|nr:hypothetical protein RRG08_052504 [Elysia crispata]
MSIYKVVARNQKRIRRHFMERKFTILHEEPGLTEADMVVIRVEEIAHQFTEPLDRMLNTPGTSLITSQGT